MFQFDPTVYKYPSRRHVVYSSKGMVATGQPLAAQAGLRMLEQGGNAVDAAVAAAASLTVVDPTGTGIGGDAFCLAYIKGRLYGLNASGPAPQALTIEKLVRQGHDKVPTLGWSSVTVPGTVSAWDRLNERFGSLPLKTVLAPAAELAEHGFPVAVDTAAAWDKLFRRYAKEAKGEEFKAWFDVFAPSGRAPLPGEVWCSKDMARTLEMIGESGSDSFYRGELAQKIADFSSFSKGYITDKDLAAFYPEWVQPISVNYHGYDVWELPPNGQGLVALLALGILDGFECDSRDGVNAVHRQVEAVKLAVADGRRYISEPKKMTVGSQDLLEAGYLAARRQLIQDVARLPETGNSGLGGTVYIAAADKEGNMVSYIQSNFVGWGSAIVVPETGIALHSRGQSFSLDPDHVNCLEPGKRPFHTIIPGFLTKDGAPIGPFGVTGGPMQPQAHVQLLINAIDLGLNPQSALDAPRWQWLEGNTIAVEPGFSEDLIAQLKGRGHDVQISSDRALFGRGEIIWRSKDGVYCGGTESRTDGYIAALY